MDLAVSLTPKTLAFYRRLLSVPAVQIPAANVLRLLAAKGVKDSSGKLQLLKVLDVLSTVEMSTDDVSFRAALASLLAAHGTSLIEIYENVSHNCPS